MFRGYTSTRPAMPWTMNQPPYNGADEQMSGSGIPRTEIFCKSLVAGVHEQEYFARSRMHPLRDHSGSQPPTRSIRPFLLEVEVGRPGQWRLARRALLPENQDTKSTQPQL